MSGDEEVGGEAEVQKEGGNIQLPNAKQRDDARKTRAGEKKKGREMVGRR